MKYKKLSVASIAIISAVTATSGVGIPAAFAMDGSGMGSSSAMQSSADGHYYSVAAGNLRVSMNNLLREHVTTSLDVTRTIVRGASDSEIQAAESAQLANSDALSAAVGSVYGGAAQAQFSDLFREHIYVSNAYAKASAAGDESGKQAAVAELQTYLHEIAAFFSGAIPGLQAQDVYGMLNEHEELINKATDAYKAHDYVQSYQLEREALKQISMAADALSGGIIATQPALFR